MWSVVSVSFETKGKIGNSIIHVGSLQPKYADNQNKRAKFYSEKSKKWHFLKIFQIFDLKANVCDFSEHKD